MKAKRTRKQKTENYLRLVFEWLLDILDSRPLRAIFWIAISIVMAFFVAFVVIIIRQGLTGVFDLITFFIWWIVLGGAFVLTNVFIIFRSEYQEYDPWIDLRYHSRIYSKIGKKDSDFLLTFHRTGTPTEIYASNISTLNRIERAFPLTLLMTAAGITLASLVITLFVFGALQTAVDINDIAVFGGLLSFCGLIIIIGLGSGIHSFWKRYRDWKDFWTAYWEFVLLKMEPSEKGVYVSEEIGSWRSVVGFRLWGYEYNLERKRVNDYVRKQTQKVVTRLQLTDALPQSDSNLVKYIDNLALYDNILTQSSYIRKDLKELAERSHLIRTVLDEFESIASLFVEDIREKLMRMNDILQLFPVAHLSLKAFEEIYNVNSIEDPDREEVRNLAEIRLQELWNLSGSPLPDSSKWIAGFYSFVSLIVAWIVSIMS